MENSKLSKRSIIRKWIYRSLASAIVILSFAFFQILGIEYLNTGLYSGWVGLAGAIGILFLIRLLFGSFKMPINAINPITNTEVTDANPSASVKIPNPATFPSNPPPHISVSRFVPNVQPDIPVVPAATSPQPSIMPQFVTSDPVENTLQKDMELVNLKQEKLEKMKSFVDKMDPRLYQTLKRRYEVERQVLKEDIKTAQRNFETSRQQPKISFSNTSATEPTIISSTSTPDPSTTKTNQNSNGSPDSNDENYSELLDRFKKLDNLLSTRLEIMKTKRPPAFPKKKRPTSDSEPELIETVV